MIVEAKLERMGLRLPEPIAIPPGVAISFEWIRVRGDRAYVSGHSALQPDGTLEPLYGKIGRDVPYDDAYQYARRTASSMLSTLKRAIGDLDRIASWNVVNGYVNALPGETKTTYAVNGFSDLILELFGPDVGAHARTAIGVEALPMNLPLVVAAQLDLKS